MNNMSLKEAIRKAFETGWIEDINDPWADLDCYGEYLNHVYNCDKCPLSFHCESWRYPK